MEAINVNVKIQIGVSEELLSLLRPVVDVLQKQATPEKEKSSKPEPKQKRVAAKQEAPAADSEPEAPVEEIKPEAESEAPVKEPVAEAPQAAEQETAPEAPAEPGTKVYTEVDVRAAMDAARQRIEGEDYKTNTESEGRKNWHRKLTAWFKNTAAVLGAEKPSELPDSDSRAAFIACCERVTVENNELTEKVPF